jgi:hypothetical protein
MLAFLSGVGSWPETEEKSMAEKNQKKKEYKNFRGIGIVRNINLH